MCTELASGSTFDMFPYNPNPYTEAQWMPSTMASVPGFEYGGATYASSHGQQQQQQHQQQQQPQQQTHHSQQQPQSHHHHHHQSPHQQPPVRQSSLHRQQGPQSRQSQHVDVSSVPPHLLDADRQKSSPGGYDGAATESSHYQEQHSQQQPQSAHSDTSRYTAGMNTYSYQSTTLPLSPPTSTAAYMSHDMGAGMGGNNANLTRASPVPIAPNPADTRKRKRTTPTPERPPELNEEEKLLLKLKEDENLPWKDIAVRFQQDIGKVYQVPALQMRFKRLRERIRQWTENDIQALEQAYEYWEKHQFEIIATKMLDFGCPERFPAKAVQRKWEELHHDRLASQRQPFPFAGANSAAAFSIGAYPGSHGIVPSQHGFVRHLPGGPGAAAAAAVAASGIGSYPGAGNVAGPGRFLFGQHPVSQPIHIPTAHGGLTGAGLGPAYGASPLISSGGKLPPAVIGAAANGPAGDGINSSTRSVSIPTPRSTGGSPGPFTASDDAALAAAAAAAAGGTTSISEVGGINMGLGLALSMSPDMANESIRTVNPGSRQRSFSDMH